MIQYMYITPGVMQDTGLIKYVVMFGLYTIKILPPHL